MINRSSDTSLFSRLIKGITKSKLKTLLIFSLILILLAVIFSNYSTLAAVFIPPNAVTKLPSHIYHMSSYMQFPRVKWRSSAVTFANLHLEYQLYMPLTRNECSGVNYFIFVLTRPSDFEIRAAARSSWAKGPPAGFLVKFVVGKPTVSTEGLDIYNKLYNEWKKFEDIIFYDAKDRYTMLHIKIYAALTWQQVYCSSAKFVFRADADTIIDLDRLQYWMSHGLIDDKHKSTSVIFGYLYKLERINRDPNIKHYISYESYPKEQIRPYVWGFFYGLSSDAIKALLNVSSSTNEFSVEDLLYTGVLAEKADVDVVDVKKFLDIGKAHIDVSKKACETKDSVPLLIAYCCVDTPIKMIENYQILKNLTCISS